MKNDRTNHSKKVTIHPGEFHASNEDITISTLLGSCVAACLFDPVNRVLGMNHFLLSNELYQNKMPRLITPSARYGVHAMELLINEMLKLGAHRSQLRAKAFGGASLRSFGARLNSPINVGRNNIDFIRKFLAIENIPLLASDLGGDRGRTIYFVASDYSVFVKKHDPVNLSNLLIKEKDYNNRIKQEQNAEAHNVSIWD